MLDDNSPVRELELLQRAGITEQYTDSVGQQRWRVSRSGREKLLAMFPGIGSKVTLGELADTSRAETRRRTGLDN